MTTIPQEPFDNFEKALIVVMFIVAVMWVAYMIF